MNQELDFGSLMPDTFLDLGNNSYGAAIDDYQAQMSDYDLRGPNAQFIGSSASYDEEEGSQRDCCARLEAALEELAALNGCDNIFFNDNIYTTVSGSVCVSSREDGKIDIVWELTSKSRLAESGGAGGQYNFNGSIKDENGVFVGWVYSTNGPYCPYQWSQLETFTKSASGEGVSGGVIPPTASYIDWLVLGYPPAGRSYL